MACGRVLGAGSWSFASLALEAVTEAPARGAGVDDVRLVGDAVNDGFREPGVREHPGPFAERQVRGHDQRSVFVALADHLEDELRGAVGQGQIAKLVKADNLGAGVAGDDRTELSAAVGFLEFVREAGEGGPPPVSWSQVVVAVVPVGNRRLSTGFPRAPVRARPWGSPAAWSSSHSTGERIPSVLCSLLGL